MGDIQLPVPLPSLCGRTRGRGGEDERICSHAILQAHDLLPAAAAGEWPLRAQVQAGRSAVCAAEASTGSPHPGHVHSRQIYRGRLGREERVHLLMLCICVPLHMHLVSAFCPLLACLSCTACLLACSFVCRLLAACLRLCLCPCLPACLPVWICLPACLPACLLLADTTCLTVSLPAGMPAYAQPHCKGTPRRLGCRLSRCGIKQAPCRPG